ncbi:hypothetical protein DPEC_G00160550 [Dallia pectoralis]|uniref:Uncharacterized protein n=1 Tax=Dallia pectoralis TaxID=75939 RepID=A0ACC2GG65_DALPE|nr:hypothetical protein DPEC_G00160550 [Dallia pectoralis]
MARASVGGALGCALLALVLGAGVEPGSPPAVGFYPRFNPFFFLCTHHRELEGAGVAEGEAGVLLTLQMSGNPTSYSPGQEYQDSIHSPGQAVFLGPWVWPGTVEVARAAPGRLALFGVEVFLGLAGCQRAQCVAQAVKVNANQPPQVSSNVQAGCRTEVWRMEITRHTAASLPGKQSCDTGEGEEGGRAVST